MYILKKKKKIFLMLIYMYIAFDHNFRRVILPSYHFNYLLSTKYKDFLLLHGTLEIHYHVAKGHFVLGPLCML